MALACGLLSFVGNRRGRKTAVIGPKKILAADNADQEKQVLPANNANQR
jgi:hypothetical protein